MLTYGIYCIHCDFREARTICYCICLCVYFHYSVSTQVSPCHFFPAFYISNHANQCKINWDWGNWWQKQDDRTQRIGSTLHRNRSSSYVGTPENPCFSVGCNMNVQVGALNLESHVKTTTWQDRRGQVNTRTGSKVPRRTTFDDAEGRSHSGHSEFTTPRWAEVDRCDGDRSLSGHCDRRWEWGGGGGAWTIPFLRERGTLPGDD